MVREGNRTTRRDRSPADASAHHPDKQGVTMRGLLSRLPTRTAAKAECQQHHWHYTSRGWVCCWGNHRVSLRGPRPEGGDECADPPVAANMRRWLTVLATGAAGQPSPQQATV